MSNLEEGDIVLRIIDHPDKELPYKAGTVYVVADSTGVAEHIRVRGHSYWLTRSKFIKLPNSLFIKALYDIE